MDIFNETINDAFLDIPLEEISKKPISNICAWIDKNYPDMNKMVIDAQTGNDKVLQLIVEIYLPLLKAYTCYIKYPSSSIYGKSAYKLYKLLIGKRRKISYQLLKWYFQPFEEIEYNEVLNELVIIFIKKVILRYKNIGSFRGYFFHFFPFFIGDWLRPKLNRHIKEKVLNYDITEEIKENKINKDFLLRTTEIPSSKIKLLFINDDFVINPKTKLELAFSPIERNIINMRFNHDMTIKDIVEFTGRNRPEIEKHFRNISRKLIVYLEKNNTNSNIEIIKKELIEKKKIKLRKGK